LKQNILTDTELRARWQSGCSVWHVEPGTILTPAARDFLREHHIELCYGTPAEPYGKMTVEPLSGAGGKSRYRDALTGAELAEKGEHMTHLRGNLLVPKTHPRIAFRGKLDCLMAQLMGVQLVAEEEGKAALAEDLEELLTHLRHILAAEVKDQPLESVRLLGMDSDEIRRVSHHVKEHIGIDHPIPSYKMGRTCTALNRLRTQVRETELVAASAFAKEDGSCSRVDILQALNRLSSCVYILFCRNLAGWYKGRS